MTAPAGAEPRTRRRALLLACEQFTDDSLPALRSPARDARAFGELLEQTGYETTTLTDCTAQEARHAVAEFFDTATRRDVNLIYFSCHGLQDAEMNLHFAFKDSQYRRPDVTGVSAEFVRTQIARSRARSTVVVADCCFSGAFLRAMRPKSSGDAGVNALVRDMPEGTGVAVLTSSGATEVSLEDPDDQRAAKSRGSYFTEALLTGIATGAADTDGDGRITVDELFSYASDRVADGPSHQKPRKYVEAVGDLVVADVRVREPEPGPPAAPPAISDTVFLTPGQIPPWPPLPLPTVRPAPVIGRAAAPAPRANADAVTMVTPFDGPVYEGAVFDARPGRRARPWRHAGIAAALVVALAGGLVAYVQWPSEAADMVPVPPVVGLTRAGAETAIRSARLVPEPLPASSAAAACTAGSVTTQAPAARSSAAEGSTVTYQVCPAKAAVPDTSGSPDPDPTGSTPKVSTKKPSAKTSSRTSKSPAPELPEVPCVGNRTAEQASAVLQNAGYGVSMITTSADATPGTVVSQSPPCHTQLPEGDTVEIFIAEEEPEPEPSLPGD